MRKGAAHWEAEIRGECLNAELQGLEDGAWYSRHPTLHYGVYTPICLGVQARENYDPRRPGFGHLRKLYRTIREPGYAEVEILSSLDAKKVTMDLDGLPIIGDISEQDVQGEFYISQGDNYRPDPKRIFKWSAAFENASELNMLNHLMGRINERGLPNFPTSPGAETLMVMKQRVAHVWAGGHLWYVDLYFWEEEDGWNERTKVRKRVRLPRKHYPFEPSSDGVTYEEDTSDGPKTIWECLHGFVKKVAGVWIHTRDTEEYDRRLFRTADFTKLNALAVQW